MAQPVVITINTIWSSIQSRHQIFDKIKCVVLVFCSPKNKTESNKSNYTLLLLLLKYIKIKLYYWNVFVRFIKELRILSFKSHPWQTRVLLLSGRLLFIFKYEGARVLVRWIWWREDGEQKKMHRDSKSQVPGRRTSFLAPCQSQKPFGVWILLYICFSTCG